MKVAKHWHRGQDDHQIGDDVHVRVAEEDRPLGHALAGGSGVPELGHWPADENTAWVGLAD